MHPLLPQLFALIFPLSLLQAASDWKTDFSAAQKLAKTNDQPLLVSFTGSDWCPPCIALEKEVFEVPNFIKEASSDFVLVKIDFPQKSQQSKAEKRQNEKLAKKYGVTSFPTVLLIRPDGTVFATTGYRPGGADKYLASLRKALPLQNFR